MIFILFFSWAFQLQLILVFQPVFTAYYNVACHWKKIQFIKKKLIAHYVSGNVVGANDTNTCIKHNSCLEIISLFEMNKKFE